jgi:hypothetical protein
VAPRGSACIAPRFFATEGAAVSVCARDAAGVTATVEALKAKGANAFGRAVDVSNAHALKSWVSDSAAALGGIDIVVANVSALAVADDEAAWQSGFDTDMMHSVRLVNAAMPWLEKIGCSGDHADFIRFRTRDRFLPAPPMVRFKAALVHYAQGLAMKTCPQGHPRQYRVTGQHLFLTAASGNRSRTKQPRSLCRGAGDEPDGSHGQNPKKSHAVWCFYPRPPPALPAAPIW